jgi:hypothetical protein
MTTPRIFKAFLLVLSLLAPVSWAHGNHIAQLKRPAFGCADKADLENITRLVSELPKGAFRTGAVRAYGNAHCIQLSQGFVSIDLWDGAYACVHQSRHFCVWVPRELIELSIVDDGVF